MKKHFGYILLVVVYTVVAVQCRMNVLKGEGSKGQITNQPGVFENVEVGVPVKVVLNIGGNAAQGVEISGYNNVIKHITTVVKNNTLYVATDLDKTWKFDDYDDVVVTISAPSIMSLNMSGAADALIHGNVAGKSFKMELSGASDVIIDSLNVDQFTSTVTGAADITINGGTVNVARYDITGAGSVKAYKLKTNETHADITGAGESELDAEQKLFAQISGAGTIKYKGHPSVSQNISGAGTLSDAN